MNETVKLTVNRIEDIDPFSGTKMIVTFRVDDKDKLLEELGSQHLLQEADEDEDLVDVTDFVEVMKKVCYEHDMNDILDHLFMDDKEKFLEWIEDNKDELMG